MSNLLRLLCLNLLIAFSLIWRHVHGLNRICHRFLLNVISCCPIPKNICMISFSLSVNVESALSISLARDSFTKERSAIGESSFTNTSSKLLSSPSTKACVHRNVASGYLQRIGDFINRDFQFICQLLGRRATFIFLFELGECFADFIQRAYLIQRKTHDTRLLCQSLQNGLTYPPYCITDEFETTCFIELSAALISPKLPSLIKSGKLKPWFWYCLATDTTKRRLARVNFSSAIRSPCGCVERALPPPRQL